MSRIQLKITCHIKSQDNLNLNVKRQSIDANTEVTRMLELSEGDFKAAVKKCFDEQLQISLKQMKTSFSKEIQNIKN